MKEFGWHKRDKLWQAQLKTDGKIIFLGSCSKKENDAARAYNTAAIEEFGEFACINVIEEDGAVDASS